MKKYFLLLLVPFMFLTNVKADEVNYVYSVTGVSGAVSVYNRYQSLINDSLSQYADSDDYYVITIQEAGALNDINLIIFDNDSVIGYEVNSYQNDFFIQNYKVMVQFYNDTVSSVADRITYSELNGQHRNLSSFFPDNLVDTNYQFIQETYSSLELTGIYSDSVIINNGDVLPTALLLNNYSSWSDYQTNNNPKYTTVDLDNYEYVLLTLKDYTSKNSFSSNLVVKGQIGITPIYNFGQTSKDDIINHQITDRCNVSYSDYTDYRIFITDTDLTNNAIYAVKSCSEGSSFKFDNTVFNITYVTNENKDDPVVTINGNTYHTIPYDDLPSTATQNEENNYIPGASENVVTGENIGLSAILKNIQKKLSEIWNIFTYFMSFVNQIFSVLPEEIRTVLVASFTIGCVLGLIKILKF